MRKMKRYKIHYSHKGQTYYQEVDAYTIKEARESFKERGITYDNIFLVRLMTNKNNHL